MIAGDGDACTTQQATIESDSMDIHQDVFVHIEKIAKEVQKEISMLELDKRHHNLDINYKTANESVSPIMMKFPGQLSPKLPDTLPALMIGSMITAIIRNQPTDLQVALGVLIRDSKVILETMHDYVRRDMQLR